MALEREAYSSIFCPESSPLDSAIKSKKLLIRPQLFPLSSKSRRHSPHGPDAEMRDGFERNSRT